MGSMNMRVVFLSILPLLLGAAVSPVATVGMITVLSSPKKALRDGFAYLLGCALPLLIIGVPGIFLFSHIDLRPGNTTIDSWIDIVAGVILLILALRLVTSGNSTYNSNTHLKKQSLSVHSSIGLGSALMLTNFSTLVLFVPAIKIVAESRLDTPEKAGLLLVSTLICLSMILMPLIVYLAVPHKAEALLSTLRKWMKKYLREITLSLLVVFGVYLLIRGIGVFGIHL